MNPENSYTFEVPLRPRSADVLLRLIEAAKGLTDLTAGEPAAVLIDIDNFTNHLRAHLQRVAEGDFGLPGTPDGQGQCGPPARMADTAEEDRCRSLR